MPNNSKQVQTAVNVLSTILGMSSSNIGHVQLPAFQKQTKQATVVTHRRNIEELMLKQGLSVASQIVLLFDKSECLSSDSRAGHQVCIAAHHKSFTLPSKIAKQCRWVVWSPSASCQCPNSMITMTHQSQGQQREQKRTLKHDSGCFLPPFDTHFLQ